MKKIMLLIFFVPLFSLAQSGDLKHYGEKISSQNAVTLKTLAAQILMGLKTDRLYQ